MKRLLFVCGLLMSALFSFAQTNTLRQGLAYLFGNLLPFAIPSGYLAPYRMDMAQRQRYNGALTDSNVMKNMDGLRMLYADVYTARFAASAPTFISVESLNKRIGGESDKLVLFYGQLE